MNIARSKIALSKRNCVVVWDSWDRGWFRKQFRPSFFYSSLLWSVASSRITRVHGPWAWTVQVCNAYGLCNLFLFLSFFFEDQLTFSCFYLLNRLSPLYINIATHHTTNDIIKTKNMLGQQQTCPNAKKRRNIMKTKADRLSDGDPQSLRPPKKFHHAHSIETSSTK
jgi:hypothetical protein